MKYTRRNFIKTSLAGLGALAVGGDFLLSSCSAAKKPTFFDPYEIVELGKSGIKGSRLTMGTGIIGGGGESNITRMGFENGVRLVKEMYEKGIRMFDSAESYGSHLILGEALKTYPRDSYAIITKIWYRGVKDLDMNAAVEKSLKELQTDYIDGVQMHCAVSPTWTTDNAHHLDALEGLKQKGIIRSHGVSCHSLEALKLAASSPWVDICHVRINPFSVNMDDTFENVVPVVEQLHKAGKGVIGMKIYGEGKFARDGEKKDESLTFALQSGIIDVMTIGMDKMSDLLDTEERILRIPRV